MGYKISRNCVCGGIVTIRGILTMKPKTTLYGIFNDFITDKVEILPTKRRCEIETRTELFYIDIDNYFANDLLFHSLPYKIEEIPYIIECPPNTPTLTNVIALPKLLEKLGYDEEISNVDLMKFLIRVTTDENFIDEVAKFYGYVKNKNGNFVKVQDGELPSEDFRKLREMNYIGGYKPIDPEPNYKSARRRIRR